jgi:hypothetical protein
MSDDQAAFRLLALYQKLRRATDPQVRETLKGNIDKLLDELDRGHGVPGTIPPSAAQERRRWGS